MEFFFVLRSPSTNLHGQPLIQTSNQGRWVDGPHRLERKLQEKRGYDMKLEIARDACGGYEGEVVVTAGSDGIERVTAVFCSARMRPSYDCRTHEITRKSLGHTDSEFSIGYRIS